MLTSAQKASDALTHAVKHTLGRNMDSSFEVFVSQDALCNYESISRGDAAKTSSHVVEVWFHLRVVSDSSGESFHSVVSKWKSVGPNQFKITDVPELVPTGSLQRAIPFSATGDVATVVP